MARGFFNRSRIDEVASKVPLNFLIILLAIIYTGFLLYQSIYFNHKLNKKVTALKKEIVQLQEKQEQTRSLIAYYKTSSFQELEARKKLGLKMPGERVVKVDVLDLASGTGGGEESREKKNDGLDRSNLDLWVDFVKGNLDEN